MSDASSLPPRVRSMRGQRALVWGACGFIGRRLVPRLLADGAQVTVLTGPVSAAPQPAWRHSVSWLTVDKANPRPEILEAAVRSADVVYNLAGPSGAVNSNRDPLTDLDLTCRPQLLFLKACLEQERSPHVIFVSTRLVYAPSGATPVTETSPVEPRSVYAAHKLCVEHYYRLFAATGRLTFSILRAPPTFGFDPMVRVRGHGIINTFIRQSVRGEPITLFGDGSQVRDFMYVDDLVDALTAASVAPGARNAILNVGGGRRIRLGCGGDGEGDGGRAGDQVPAVAGRIRQRGVWGLCRRRQSGATRARRAPTVHVSPRRGPDCRRRVY